MENKYVKSQTDIKTIFYYDLIINKYNLRELLTNDYKIQSLTSLNILRFYQNYIINYYKDNQNLNINKQFSAYKSEITISFNTEDENLFNKIKKEAPIFEKNILRFIDIIANEYVNNRYFAGNRESVIKINKELNDHLEKLLLATNIKSKLEKTNFEIKKTKI